MITVRECTADEMIGHASFSALGAEYAAECAMDGLPPPEPKMEMYRMIYQSGILHPLGAFDGDAMVGFVVLLTPVIPHYGYTIAVAESLFVAAAARSTGAGIKLIRAAEKHARDSGCPAILFSAQINSPLEKVTNTVHMKDFHHE